MAPVRAVLFDLDGTLVDSAEDLTFAVNVIMKRRNLPTFDVATVSSFVGKGALVLMEKAMKAQGITCTAQELFSLTQEYAQIMVEENNALTKFFPDTLESLDRLKQAGMKLALVTNKMRAITIAFLKDRNLLDCFDAIVAGDDTPNPKPAGDMLEIAMREMQVSPADSVMVGDSQNDALAGRAAGTRVILVGTGYNEDKPIDEWARDNGFNPSFPNLRQATDAILAMA